MPKEVTQPAAEAVVPKTTTRMTIEPSTKGNHLVFTQAKFEDGLEVSLKRGILMVDDEYDADELAEKARQSEWILKGPKDASGFYKPVRKGADDSAE